MAKAAAKTTEEPAGDLGAQLLKMFGENDATADDAGFISTGYLPLNHACSNLYYDGGIPRGRITEISGPPSAGKTSLVTDIMITAQKAGGFAGFMDHERSFDMRLGKSRGLSDDPAKWFYRKPRTFQESIGLYTQVAVAIRNSKKLGNAPIVWAFDSLASMVPEAILIKMMAGEKMSMRDKLELSLATSTYFPSLATIAEELDITTIFLNQIRTKPGIVYGDPTTTPGGDAPKFYATCRIQLGATRLTEEIKEGSDTYKIQVGSEVTARVIKNKACRPFQRAKWIFTFRNDGTGYFDAIGSITDLLINKDLIPKTSRKGFYSWEGKERSRNQLVALLTAQPDGLAVLEKILIDGGIGSEYDAEAERAVLEATADAAVLPEAA